MCAPQPSQENGVTTLCGLLLGSSTGRIEMRKTGRPWQIRRWPQRSHFCHAQGVQVWGDRKRSTPRLHEEQKKNASTQASKQTCEDNQRLLCLWKDKPRGSTHLGEKGHVVDLPHEVGIPERPSSGSRTVQSLLHPENNHETPAPGTHWRVSNNWHGVIF